MEPKRLPSGKTVGEPRLWLANLPSPGLLLSRSIGDDMATSVGCTARPEITFVAMRPYLGARGGEEEKRPWRGEKGAGRRRLWKGGLGAAGEVGERGERGGAAAVVESGGEWERAQGDP